MIKSKKLKLVLVFVLVFLGLLILIKKVIKQTEYKTESNTLKVQEFVPKLEVTDIEQRESEHFIERLKISKYPDIKDLEKSFKPIHCESFTYEPIQEVKNFASRRLENKNILTGIEAIEKGLGEQSQTYEFCNSNGNFYLVYSDPEHYPFSLSSLFNIVRPVYAGSGKTAYSISRIKEDGTVKTVNNYEAAISKQFKELSFYFTCTDVFGDNSASKVYVACFGSEGYEDTFGLLAINFDTNISNYLVYCINPLEENSKMSESGLPQNDNIYSCYDENRQLYFNGSIDTNYRFGNE